MTLSSFQSLRIAAAKAGVPEALLKAAADEVRVTAESLSMAIDRMETLECLHVGVREERNDLVTKVALLEEELAALKAAARKAAQAGLDLVTARQAAPDGPEATSRSHDLMVFNDRGRLFGVSVIRQGHPFGVNGFTHKNPDPLIEFWDLDRGEFILCRSARTVISMGPGPISMSTVNPFWTLDAVAMEAVVALARKVTAG